MSHIRRFESELLAGTQTNDLGLSYDIDVYSTGVLALYTPPPKKPFDFNLGPSSGSFNLPSSPTPLSPYEPPQKLFESNSLPKFQQSPSLPKYNPIGSQGSGFQKGSKGNIRIELPGGLQERYDFSRHGNTDPHLNYDLLGAKKEFVEKALGDVHHKDLDVKAAISSLSADQINFLNETIKKWPNKK